MKDLCYINKCLEQNNYPLIEKIGNINNWTMYRSIKKVGDKRFLFTTYKDNVGEFVDSTIEVCKIFDEEIKFRERNSKLVPYEIIITVEFDVFRDINKCEEYLLAKLDEISR